MDEVRPQKAEGFGCKVARALAYGYVTVSAAFFASFLRYLSALSCVDEDINTNNTELNPMTIRPP